MILDDGGDATLLMHLGQRAEKDAVAHRQADQRRRDLPLRRDQGQARRRPDLVLAQGRRDHRRDRGDDDRRAPPEGDERKGTLLFRAINVNDSVTKSKFDNLYGCRESLVDGIKRATDVMIAGKVACVAGYGDVGKGSAQALRALSAQVWVTEIDPINALQAAMEGYKVVTMEYAADKADIFVTTTGNKGVIRHEHMAAMKDQAIVCNIGHFDNEIDIASLEKYAVGRDQAAGRPRDLPRRQEDHPARQGAAREPRLRHRPPELRDELELRQPDDRADRALHASPSDYKVGQVYVLPKHLDEKVARLHLKKVGAMLTELTDEQAAYIGVAKEGPYKPDTLPLLMRGVSRMRVDQLLVQRGLAPTRSAAQRLIATGAVRWRAPAGWRVPAKAGEDLPSEAELEVTDDAELRFVSRGGLKLDGALTRARHRRARHDLPRRRPEHRRLHRRAAAARRHARRRCRRRPRPAARAARRPTRASPRSRASTRAISRPRQLPVARFDLVVGDLSFISLALVLPALVPLLGGDAAAARQAAVRTAAGRHRHGRAGQGRERLRARRERSCARPAPRTAWRCSPGSTARRRAAKARANSSCTRARAAATSASP